MARRPSGSRRHSIRHRETNGRRPVMFVRRGVLAVLCCAFGAGASAQTTDCVVSGPLFNSDGTPAILKQVPATSVVKSGASFIITPLSLNTDAAGGTTFAV